MLFFKSSQTRHHFPIKLAGKRRILFLPILFFVFTCPAQLTTFTFNINGTAPGGLAEALRIAGEKWSNYLQITIPVKVNVFLVNTSLAGASAITLANGRQNFTNAPMNNVLYTTALANQIANTETNPGESDMDIYFNLNTPFYFGKDLPPSFQTDFITTAMHEIGHGLGFYSDGFVDSGGKGSFGNIPQSAVFPLYTSFTWWGQDSVPSIFDKFIVRFSGNQLISSAGNNSTALGDSIKNGAVFFNGPIHANPANSNIPVRLAGGEGSFTLGVDLLHIHETYLNTIMSYGWDAGDTVRTPALWERGILEELGWNTKPVGLEETETDQNVSCFPNPANEAFIVRGEELKKIDLYNSTGEFIQSMTNNEGLNSMIIAVSRLPEGIYFVRISCNNRAKAVTKKIMVVH
jgi:hypothetical protein